jgi:predicted nucleotidyltransferase
VEEEEPEAVFDQPEKIMRGTMRKPPKDPKEIFDGIVSDYTGVFGDGLVSIICFGSAARGEYRPGKSDINFIIVLEDDTIEKLDEAFDIIARWHSSNVATPVFVTEAYVYSSVDVFPIEYLDMQRSRILVFGKDVLSQLTFENEHIRLQCEKEVKGKLLLLRERFAETHGKAKALCALIGESLVAFIAIFEGLLHLKGLEIPSSKNEIMAVTCRSFGLDGGLFETLLRIRDGKLKPSNEESTNYFKQYLKQIKTLSRIVDSIGGSNEPNP